MNKHDKITITAAHHFSITEDGELSRDSTPYPMNKSTKLGVGFDYLDSVSGYMRFNFRISRGSKQVQILTHRMIFYIENGFLPEEVDHRDNNKSNNHPSNLRGVTHQQNGMNRSSAKNATSNFLGVCWCKRSKKWASKIKINGKQKYLGSFICEHEAASHYNLAAIELFGEFANLNDTDIKLK